MLGVKVIGIAASAILLVSLLAGMPQASAEKVEISMKIVNKKYDNNNVIQLAHVYTFGHTVTVDVTDMQLYKIDKIFGKTTFTFSWSSKMYEAEYYPWDVSISMPVSAGKSLKVQFV